MRILLIDNYDSFTFMLRDYIEQCGASCRVIRNDEKDLLEEAALYEAFVISPGPQTPQQAGKLMELMNRYARLKPVLGVCLGHQAIGTCFGASLLKAGKPMHGKIDQIEHRGNALFSGVPRTFHATRYHSLVLKELPVELEVIANSSSGEVMGIAHKTLPLWGIQFHPESCMTMHGKQLIENFLLLAGQKQ